MGIYLGSRLRINFTFRDLAEDGTLSPIDLSGVVESVRIVKPDGSEVDSPSLTVISAPDGTAYWEAAADVLDRIGVWKAQGIADGYRSEPVSWRVEANP